MVQVLMETNLSLKFYKQGKVRDIYDLGEYLLVVATDRISTFDCVHPTGIPDKGKILNQLSGFWFDFIKKKLEIEHHLISYKTKGSKYLPRPLQYAPILFGRSSIVKKVQVIPVECVVRGYLYGSAWKEYQKTGEVSGQKLPAGLKEADILPQPIFTPSTKEETGHDENITLDRMVKMIGKDLATRLQDLSLRIYTQARIYAEKRGVIIADTKFEFGIDSSGRILVIDELLTPDSSRFWPLDQYQPGGSQPSFDKQYVRDYVTSIGWNKKPPAPELPDDIVWKTRKKYIEAYERLVGKKFR